MSMESAPKPNTLPTFEIARDQFRRMKELWVKIQECHDVMIRSGEPLKVAPAYCHLQREWDDAYSRFKLAICIATKDRS